MAWPRVGGGSSALALARSLGRKDLVLPSILVGSLGTASGTFLGMANAIRAKHPGAPLPKAELPKWLVWAVGPMMNKALTRRFINRNIGHRWQADNSKVQKALGLTFSSSDDAVLEMYEQMKAAGALKT